MTTAISHTLLRALDYCMSVHCEDILSFMKNCATHLQDALFLRKIEVDCIIEGESDAFCKDWIQLVAGDISFNFYMSIASKLTMCVNVTLNQC